MGSYRQDARGDWVPVFIDADEKKQTASCIVVSFETSEPEAALSLMVIVEEIVRRTDLDVKPGGVIVWSDLSENGEVDLTEHEYSFELFESEWEGAPRER